MGTGVKRQTLDAFVNSNLDLTDRELATDSFTMYVLNSSNTAVTNTLAVDTGFVSSLDGGALWWQTGLAASYLFPVGSSLNIKRYRPIQLELTTSGGNGFGVRLANNDATNENFNIS